VVLVLLAYLEYLGSVIWVTKVFSLVNILIDQLSPTNNNCASVDGGYSAVVFNRLVGVKSKVYGEGTHLLIPIVETPVIYSVRSKPRNISSPTGSKGKYWFDSICCVY
jgi:hypothetical protein